MNGVAVHAHVLTHVLTPAIMCTRTHRCACTHLARHAPATTPLRGPMLAPCQTPGKLACLQCVQHTACMCKAACTLCWQTYTRMHTHTAHCELHTRHVINDQDVVPRGGKFIALYKRNGHRAIVNRVGACVPSVRQTLCCLQLYIVGLKSVCAALHAHELQTAGTSDIDCAPLFPLV